MKYPLCCALLFAASSSAFAGDISKGTIAVGGASNFSIGSTTANRGDDDEVSTATSSLAFDTRYYFDTNLALTLGFERTRTEVDDGEDTAGITTHAVIPGIGFTHPLNDQTNVDLGLGWLFNGERYSLNGEGVDIQGQGIQMSAALRHFIASNVSVDGLLTYQRYRMENENYDYRSDFSGSRFSAGLTVYFGK